MKPLVALYLLVASLLLSPTSAQARACNTISMTAVSPGTIAYVPSNTTDKVYAASATVTCNRTAGGAASDTVNVTPGTATGILTTTAPASPTITFHLNKDATVPCSSGTKWTNAAPFALTFNNVPSPPPQTVNFYVCVPSSQAGLVPPEGTYTQTQTLTAARGPTTGTASITTTILAPASCTFNTSPGNINFGTYAAFGGALSANTSFVMKCSNQLPYSLDVGATAGGVVGGTSLYYTLGITANTPGVGTNPLNNLTGNGGLQTYYINGVMPSGQAGACATATCANQTQSRTLTVTY
jgi:spore coat protein U-like protein